MCVCVCVLDEPYIKLHYACKKFSNAKIRNCKKTCDAELTRKRYILYEPNINITFVTLDQEIQKTIILCQDHKTNLHNTINKSNLRR